MLPTYYNTGTVSVAAGGTTVTGAGTGWGEDVILAGDLFMDPAQPAVPPQRIRSITDNTHLVLALPWPGAAMAAVAYEIRFVGDIERSTAQTRRYLEMLGAVDNTGIGIDAFGNFVDRPLYDDMVSGFTFLSLNGAGVAGQPAYIYIKNSSAHADWSAPITFIGGVGPPGVAGAPGEPIICQIQQTNGIAPGTYPATRYYHGAATFDHLFAEVLVGSGAGAFYVQKNGIAVYGPVAFDSALGPVNASDIAVSLAIGDRVSVVITGAAPTIVSLLVQLDGST